MEKKEKGTCDNEVLEGRPTVRSDWSYNKRSEGPRTEVEENGIWLVRLRPPLGCSTFSSCVRAVAPPCASVFIHWTRTTSTSRPFADVRPWKCSSAGWSALQCLWSSHSFTHWAPWWSPVLCSCCSLLARFSSVCLWCKLDNKLSESKGKQPQLGEQNFPDTLKADFSRLPPF